MKKILGCGCLIVVVIALIVGIFAWRIVKGVSKQKDLGLTATETQVEAARQKVGVTLETLPDSTPLSQSIQYSGSHATTYSMDSQELTAIAAFEAKYTNFPFKNTQIRVNPDGSMEISTVADTMKAFDYATAIGFAPADLEKVMKDYNIPRTTIPVYVKGTGSVTNGKVTLNLTSGNVAGIPVPMGLVNGKKAQIINILETGMRNTPGFEAKSLTFSDGKMNFDGSLPDKRSIVE